MIPVSENLATVREELRLAGVDLSRVSILGVTKAQDPGRIREGVAAGLLALGNNYAQEGEALMASMAGMPVQWHFIGHIQSRKVKYLGAYHCVQSLDRIEVARKLEERLAGDGRRMEVLVELNLGDEGQKLGIHADQLPSFLEELTRLPHLDVRGLMGMPPPLDPVERRRPFFRKLRELAERFALPQLSMGTSEDFVVAAQEGATMLRLGTRLFGERPGR